MPACWNLTAPLDLAPDFIIEVDNKSLTHRPDLWGHYGMAREVAAILGQAIARSRPAHRLRKEPAPIRVTDRRLRAVPALLGAGF